jgi:hypothetical protein
VMRIEPRDGRGKRDRSHRRRSSPTPASERSLRGSPSGRRTGRRSGCRRTAPTGTPDPFR